MNHMKRFSGSKSWSRQNDRPLDQIDAEALETSLADMEGSLTSARSSLEASRTRLEGMYDALENNGDKEALQRGDSRRECRR